MSAEKLREIFEQMPDHYEAGTVSQDTTYYFSLGDGEGEKWTVYLTPDDCRVVEGKDQDRCDCVVKTSSKLFLKMIVDGYRPGVMDFTRGKIKTNSLDLLKDLADIFKQS